MFRQRQRLCCAYAMLIAAHTLRTYFSLLRVMLIDDAAACYAAIAQDAIFR